MKTPRNIQKKLWKTNEPDIDASARITTQLKTSPLLAQILTTRGIDTVTDAQKYLYPELSHMHSPYLLHDMAKAVDRLRTAIDNQEKIYIYGDYDVDGTTSIALLLEVFEHIAQNQLQAQYYIPDRFDEGYGLNKRAIEKLHEKGCQLLISVDCGITAIEEIELANSLGMDVIVIDHHEPRPDVVPSAYAVIDPKLKECDYPYKDLAAVGLSFKFAHALFDEEELPPVLKSQLDLVALGTVVDVAPLTGENRILTKFGLKEINKRDRIGIKALCDLLQYKREITSYTLGFVIGPRLNAAGRLDTAHNVVKLLTSKSYEEARKIAEQLDGFNRKRREIEGEIYNQAVAKVKKNVDLEKDKGIVLSSPNWHSGVIGIVASKIMEQYYRPVFLISIEEEECHGSGRSIPEFHIADSLNECADLMLDYGGHEAAAGLTITKENIPKFRERFNKITCLKLSDEDIIPKVMVDLETPASLLILQNVEELKLMEPFGQDNPHPVISLHGVSLSGVPRLIGSHNNHLKFNISSETLAFQADKKSTIEVVGWNMDWRFIAMRNAIKSQDTRIDLAFKPEINDYAGNRKVQLNLSDLKLYRNAQIPQPVYPPLDQDSSIKIVNRRDLKSKSDYIHNLLSRDERTIFYVRDELTLSQIAKMVARTNRSISLCSENTTTEELEDIYDKFKRQTIKVIASCVTLNQFPATKHLVFCHPVPTLREFIEKCQSAFETEETTFIHLIYAQRDVNYMLESLKWEYPTRDMLAELYRVIRTLAEESGNTISSKKILAKAKDQSIKEPVVNAGLVIFEELELIKVNLGEKELSIEFFLQVEDSKELYQSEMYLKGEAMRQKALLFSDTLLNKSAEEIWQLL